MRLLAIILILIMCAPLAYADEEKEKQPPGCCLDIWNQGEQESHAYWWREKDGYRIKYSLKEKTVVIVERKKLSTDDLIEFYFDDQRKTNI